MTKSAVLITREDNENGNGDDNENGNEDDNYNDRDVGNDGDREDLNDSVDVIDVPGSKRRRLHTAIEGIVPKFHLLPNLDSSSPLLCMDMSAVIFDILRSPI